LEVKNDNHDMVIAFLGIWIDHFQIVSLITVLMFKEFADTIN
jgi:hypothetical protein